MSALDSLFPPRESVGPKGPLRVMPWHYNGDAIRVQSVLLPSNAVFLGLWDPGRCFSLIHVFQGFQNDVLSMDSC